MDIKAESLSSCSRPSVILLFFHCREEIPPEEDQWEKAAHKRVYRQTAAVSHLEDGERVLWVCTGAVPVCQGTCCQRKGRGALPAGTKLLLRENLPQKLKRHCRTHVERTLDPGRDKKKNENREVRLKDFWRLWGGFVCAIEDIKWSFRTITLWRSDQTGGCSVIYVCASQLDKEVVFRQQVVFPAAPVPPLPFTSISKVRPLPAYVRSGDSLSNSWSDLGSWLASLYSNPDIFIGSVLFGCVWLYFNSLLWLSFCM